MHPANVSLSLWIQLFTPLRLLYFLCSDANDIFAESAIFLLCNAFYIVVEIAA